MSFSKEIFLRPPDKKFTSKLCKKSCFYDRQMLCYSIEKLNDARDEKSACGCEFTFVMSQTLMLNKCLGQDKPTRKFEEVQLQP